MRGRCPSWQSKWGNCQSGLRQRSCSLRASGPARSPRQAPCDSLPGQPSLVVGETKFRLDFVILQSVVRMQALPSGAPEKAPLWRLGYQRTMRTYDPQVSGFSPVCASSLLPSVARTYSAASSGAFSPQVVSLGLTRIAFGFRV
jgi:hypothetical protein